MNTRRFSGLAAMLLLMAALAGCRSKEKYLENADTFLEKGEYSLALESYNKAIMEDEELQEAYRGAGIASMKMADYEHAEDFFLRALKETDGIISDMELDLSYYLGEAQINLGKYKDAITTYSNVLEYDKKETDAYFYRGCAYLRQGEEDKAKKDFEKAAADGDLECLYGIYEAYAQIGREDGMAYLEQVAEAKPQSAQDYYTAGKACLSLGNEEKAVEYLQKSEKDGVAAATFYLGYLYDQKGDYDTARTYYGTYKEKHGLTLGEYHVVADCMMKQGDYAAALELNQYMSESAGRSEQQDLAFEQIVIYEKNMDYESARNAAQSFVEQYPDDEEGQREYEFLRSR